MITWPTSSPVLLSALPPPVSPWNSMLFSRSAFSAWAADAPASARHARMHAEHKAARENEAHEAREAFEANAAPGRTREVALAIGYFLGSMRPLIPDLNLMVLALLSASNPVALIIP